MIIDHQAKVGAAQHSEISATVFVFQETVNRFVRVGELGEEEVDLRKRKERFVILQRSRREHYDLVLSQGEETLGRSK